MQPEIREVSRLSSGNGSDAEAGSSQVVHWGEGTKIVFRFAFVYFLLYNQFFPFQLLAFPPFSQLSGMYNSLWLETVHWVSRHLLHLSHDFATDYLNSATGSKDTTFVYVQVLCYLVVAAVATVIWSLLDRRRRNYDWLFNWFLAYMRLALAAIMIPYGVAKLFPWQFPALSLSKLLQTYGDSSPMGLMWTFMGASPRYSFFGGAAEVLAGMLLVVPQLGTLGALICAGVMSNVLMLNLGYDVPVKCGSINLIVMSAIIAAPDLRRLTNFFVLNRRVEPAPARPLFRRPVLNGLAILLQIAFGVVLLVFNVYRDNQKTRQLIQSRTTAPLYGIWSVDEFKIDRQVRPPLLTDPIRWNRLIVESVQDAEIQPMTGQFRYLYLHFDEQNKSFSLTSPYGPGWIARFAYESPQPDLLVLTGKMDGQPVSVTLHKEDASKFLLNSRGFHWVQEYSVNR